MAVYYQFAILRGKRNRNVTPGRYSREFLKTSDSENLEPSSYGIIPRICYIMHTCERILNRVRNRPHNGESCRNFRRDIEAKKAINQRSRVSLRMSTDVSSLLAYPNCRRFIYTIYTEASALKDLEFTARSSFNFRLFSVPCNLIPYSH